MALFLDKNDFVLYSSKNLKKWTHFQDVKLPGSSECPDFFPLAVDGNPVNTRWVFWGGNGRYLLGTFDGRKFNQQAGPFESRVGNFYASQTYSDIPESDGRRIQIAWMAGVRTFPEGIRLCRVPVREIENLRSVHWELKDTTLQPGEKLLSAISAELFEIQAEIELGSVSEITFNLRGNPLTYNVNDKMLSCKGKKVKLDPIDDVIKLHILVDRTSIEVFPNYGQVTMHLCFPLDPEKTLQYLSADGGKANIKSLKLYRLKSIWQKA
jgi:sucrose-6-phosphate hydrolase SacC (GH32 family)